MAGLDTVVTKVKDLWKAKVKPWAQKEPGQAALAAAAVTVGGLLWIGGSVIVNGVIAGALVAGAAGVLLWKLSHSGVPQVRVAYNYIVRYPLASDIALSVVALSLAPAGITGWISAAVTALLASIWLFGASEVPLEDEPVPVHVKVKEDGQWVDSPCRPEPPGTTTRSASTSKSNQQSPPRRVRRKAERSRDCSGVPGGSWQGSPAESAAGAAA
jgi:hypothetical protein